MKSKQIEEKEIISLENVCWDFYKSCVCLTIFTQRCKMQNNYNNWFHLSPHLGLIQLASAPSHPFIQQPISRTTTETQMAEECPNSKRDWKTKTREKWSAKQTELLVKLWVENFEIIESSRCNQVWPRTADKIYTLKAHRKQ